MSITHLNDKELNLAVLGEELPPEAAEHLAGCVACVRRRDSFLTTVEMARGTDPDEATRARVRERALAAWGAPNRRWVRWLAAAAAVLVLSLLPLRLHRTAPPSAINADAVMVEVEQMLDRDPLSAVAAEEIVDTVVPVSAESGERSVS
jgi:anti-sigma factor RsiW